MNVMDIFETMEYGPAPEAAAPGLDWIKAHQPFDLFINNRWTRPAGGQYMESINPGSGKTLARVAAANSADVDAAVAAARKAFTTWGKTPGHVRARYLYALARSIQKHSRLLAVLESLDNGKPIRETRDIDIPLVARHFYYHAGWAQLMETGLPPGVVNIITGEASAAGEALVNHPEVNKIAFTGSTDVGRSIRRATAGSGKKLSLELGGKSPFIVFDDADLDSVVEGVVDAIWFNQGQVCCAGSRLLVQENVAEKLYSKLRARMEHLRV